MISSLYYCTGRARENSEVSPVEFLVAVAVTTSPAESAAVKVKEALPLRLVLTGFSPRNVLPSPKPDGSAVGLEKNWMVKVFLGRLVSVPLICVVLAEVRLGKFCRLLGPVSGSFLSLGVGPSSSRPSSMPSRPLSKMELRRMRLPVAQVQLPTKTPWLVLPEMVLAAASTVPPTVLSGAPAMRTPCRLARFPVPVALVPMKWLARGPWPT